MLLLARDEGIGGICIGCDGRYCKGELLDGFWSQGFLGWFPALFPQSEPQDAIDIGDGTILIGRLLQLRYDGAWP